MNADQKARLTAAVQQFTKEDYAGSLAGLRQLLVEIPGDPLMSKFAAEAAINTGDYPTARSLISGVLATNPDDWQAHTLHARLTAQEGDGPARDAEIKAIKAMGQKGTMPQNVTQFPIERVKVGDRSLLIFQSVYPWGKSRVYNYARLFDSSGKLLMWFTLDSSDMEQTFYLKEHPEAATSGARQFAYDGYSDNGANAQGQHGMSQALYGFVYKEPTYDEMRAKFIQIAGGQGQPAATSTSPAK
jgi:hypothetical protein